MEPKITSLIVRLSASEYETLMAVARMTGRTKSDAVRYALNTTLLGLQVVAAETERALRKGGADVA